MWCRGETYRRYNRSSHTLPSSGCSLAHAHLVTLHDHDYHSITTRFTSVVNTRRARTHGAISSSMNSLLACAAECCERAGIPFTGEQQQQLAARLHSVEELLSLSEERFKLLTQIAGTDVRVLREVHTHCVDTAFPLQLRSCWDVWRDDTDQRLVLTTGCAEYAAHSPTRRRGHLLSMSVSAHRTSAARVLPRAAVGWTMCCTVGCAVER